MILRKPYAFFIKYFRIIHLIMAIFMCLLVFQTNSFLQFFNQYINSEIITIGQDLVSQLFSKLTYFYIVLILIMDVIVWILLEFKNKKRLFYIINFIGYVLLLALYIYLGSLLGTMSQEVVDIRLLMTVRDLIIIAFSFQTVSIFLVIFRFLGFDIKKFNFEDDLKELNISSADNEEFEVNLDVDTKSIKRRVNSSFRNFKYYFKENLRLIIPILLVLIIVFIIIIYKAVTGRTMIYKQNVYFNVPNYSLKVTDAFVTEKNYKMNSISEDKAIVILKISVKTTNRTSQFLFGKFALQIEDNKYYHTVKYSSDVSDIGNTYIKQSLSNQYSDYLLVYEIPKSKKNSKKELIYVNDISSSVLKRDSITKVSLNTTDLDANQEEKEVSLNDEINLNSSVANISTIKFNTISVANSFNINYKKCITSKECYTFYEPLQAGFYGSYDKALMKLQVEVKSDKLTDKTEANYIKQFIKINYKIKGESKTFYLEKQIIPRRVNSNYYYFEIPKEILQAEEIKFIFNTRGTTLIYKLK